MAAVVGMGRGVGEEGELREESRGSVSVGQGIFPCDAEDGWRMAYGVMSVRQVGRALWDSRGLSRLERSRWHKVVKPAEWTRWLGKNVKSMKRRGTGPNTDEAEKSRSQQTRRAESAKPKERGSKIRVI